MVSPDRKRQAALHLQDHLNGSERRACQVIAQPRVTAAHLRREGWTLNDKRAQRLWREEGLKVPRRQRKLRRLGSSANSAQRLRATRVNEVWSYDFVFDQTEDG